MFAKIRPLSPQEILENNPDEANLAELQKDYPAAWVVIEVGADRHQGRTASVGDRVTLAVRTASDMSPSDSGIYLVLLAGGVVETYTTQTQVFGIVSLHR